MNRFAIERERILFDNGKEIAFAQTITKALDFGNAIVIMLDVPQGTIFNENVYGIDRDGNILWQVSKEKYVYEDSPYTDIQLAGNAVVLYNWDGLRLSVEPATGRILKKEYGR